VNALTVESLRTMLTPVRECIFVSDAGAEDAFAPGRSLLSGSVRFLIEHRSASVRLMYIPLLFGISLAVKWVGMKPGVSASEVAWLPITWHFSFQRHRIMATNVVSWITESEAGTGSPPGLKLVGLSEEK